MNLHREIWSARDPRAAVLLIHGIGEHCGRYVNLVTALNASGFSVYGFDQRGHGRSPGRRGHVSSWSDYVVDARAQRDWVVREARGLPVFVFGHSMGSLIALDLLLRHPEGIRAAAVTGVPFRPVGVAKPADVAAYMLQGNVKTLTY